MTDPTGTAFGAGSATVVWISGASAGIGAALAAGVPFDDATVIDISRRGPASGPGGGPTQRVEHLRADLADPSSWPVVADHFADRLRRFDGERVVFIHNAATLTPIGPVASVDPVAYRRNVLLNSAAPQVLGAAFLRAVADLKCEQHLILLTSGAARRAYPGESSYCAGKAAVDQWVRVVGEEQRRYDPGCRVVAVAPGVVETAMQEEIRATDDADFPAAPRFRDLYRSGSLSTPEQAAAGIWSLLGRDLDNGAVVDLRDL